MYYFEQNFNHFLISLFYRYMKYIIFVLIPNHKHVRVIAKL